MFKKLLCDRGFLFRLLILVGLMNIYFVSIFPDIYDSFVSTSLVDKARSQGVVDFEFVNPRDYTHDKHNQIDDEIYGIGSGMLMKAKPMIDALEDILSKIKDKSYKILYLAPSQDIFDQQKAQTYSQVDNLILVSGRYEGIDHRFEKYMSENYTKHFHKISLGKFVLMGGEVASMVVAEAVIRLIPGLIKKQSIENDSYNIDKNMKNIEHPQYTRPRKVYGMGVPDVLLSGDHQKIADWKKDSSDSLDD